MKFGAVFIIGENIPSRVAAILYEAHFRNLLNQHDLNFEAKSEVLIVPVSAATDLHSGKWMEASFKVNQDLKDCDAVAVYTTSVNYSIHGFVDNIALTNKDTRLFGISSELAVLPAIQRIHPPCITINIDDQADAAPVLHTTLAYPELYMQRINHWGELVFECPLEVILEHKGDISKLKRIHDLIARDWNVGTQIKSDKKPGLVLL